MDLGIGTTNEFFQSDGKVLVDNEDLKMRESGREIEKAVLMQHSSCDLIQATS